MQQLSEQGEAFLISWEAIYLYAYPDPGTGGDPITIGIGATKYDGQGGVRLGDTITIERAVARFRETIARKYAPGVRSAIRVPLEWFQFDMAVSIHYNTGAIKSGSIDDKLNRGDEAAALRTWAQYTKSGGRTIRGLILRRQAEIAVWRTGKYPERKIVLRTSPGTSPRYLNYEDLPKGDGKIHVTEAFPPLSAPPAPPSTGKNFVVGLLNLFVRLINEAFYRQISAKLA